MWLLFCHGGRGRTDGTQSFALLRRKRGDGFDPLGYRLTHHQEDVGVAPHAHAGARRAGGGVVLALGAPEEREEEAGLDELVAEDGGAERGHQEVEAEAVDGRVGLRWVWINGWSTRTQAGRGIH